MKLHAIHDNFALVEEKQQDGGVLLWVMEMGHAGEENIFGFWYKNVEWPEDGNFGQLLERVLEEEDFYNFCPIEEINQTLLEK